MDTDDVDARLLFLLREAGPHRACELATVVGCTTHHATIRLSALRAQGKVDRVAVSSSVDKWFSLPKEQSVGSGSQ